MFMALPTNLHYRDTLVIEVVNSELRKIHWPLLICQILSNLRCINVNDVFVLSQHGYIEDIMQCTAVAKLICQQPVQASISKGPRKCAQLFVPFCAPSSHDPRHRRNEKKQVSNWQMKLTRDLITLLSILSCSQSFLDELHFLCHSSLWTKSLPLAYITPAQGWSAWPSIQSLIKCHPNTLSHDHCCCRRTQLMEGAHPNWKSKLRPQQIFPCLNSPLWLAIRLRVQSSMEFLTQMIDTGTPCNLTISSIVQQLGAGFPMGIAQKCAEWVSLSTITHTASCWFLVLGSPVTKSIVTFSHFHSTRSSISFYSCTIMRCSIPFPAPFKLNSLYQSLCQGNYYLRKLREVLHSSPVITGKTKETPNFRNILRPAVSIASQHIPLPIRRHNVPNKQNLFQLDRNSHFENWASKLPQSL